MHILIATPLYPPDIAGHAPYVKELAQRLCATHTVTVLLYGDYPETIPRVNFRAISKQQPTFIRLWKYTTTLLSLLKEVDVVYMQNGPSVELPMLCAKVLSPRKPFILHVFDNAAFTYSNKMYRALFRRAARLSKLVYTYADNVSLVPHSSNIKTTTRIPERPEILPFAPYPDSAYTFYNTGWDTHVEMLVADFTTLCSPTR